MTPPPRVYADKAPPPKEAVISMVLLFVGACYFLPSLSEIDELAKPDTFIHRLYPQTVSLGALVYIRFLFFLLCAYVTISACVGKGIYMDPTYLPASKLKPTQIHLFRHKCLFPFTCWSWNILGLHFGLSAYIAVCLGASQNVSPWLLRTSLILWETAAPLTLLVSAVVKYAIWPMCLKEGKSSAVLRTHRGLLQHNANVFMALVEVALLGGLPIQLKHISLSILFGTLYVFFTWSIMEHWNTPGPACIYFFMDTTLGRKHTLFLFGLLGILVVFYAIYAGVGSFLETYENASVHVGFVVIGLLGTCRFRD